MNHTRRPRPSRSLRGITMVAAVLAAALPVLAADAKPDVHFNRDIRPLLGDNCLACHGPDPGARKADLRLDTKDGLFNATAKRGAPVIPGSPEKSELWKRITATDPDDIMPPPKSHKVLTPEQKEMFKQWILAGAPWQGHWAFIQPEREKTPAVKNAAWVRNPIDAFVLAKLESKGLAPAPEADRRTLARRVSLDLTGLPPSPEEVERFVKDRAPDAYEKYVERVLLSPHWGEHRARYWLDAARYADTHGLHFDNYREMWPYRDYVIRSFNQNKSFKQFIVEQIAGDLLPDATDEQLIATGFHRCNMTTNEGGTIEEENLCNYANDRVTTTGWVFLGLTMNCSACHDHKFDPVTQKDFYSMAAYFRNTTQTGFDKNRREGDLYIVAPQTEAERTRWKALPGEIEAAKKAREVEAKAASNTFTNWLVSAKADKLARKIELANDYLELPLTEGKGRRVTAAVAGKAHHFDSATNFAWRTDGPLGSAPVLAKEQNISLGDLGDLDPNEPFSIGAWVWVPKDFKGDGSVLARMAGDDQRSRGWDFYLKDEEFGINLVHRSPAVTLRVRTKDKAVKRGVWQHIQVTYDGSLRADGVKLFVQGRPAPVQVEQDRLEGTIHVDLPLRLGRREQTNVLNGVAVQGVRMVQRQLDGAEIRANVVAPRAGDIFKQAAGKPGDDGLHEYFLATQHRGWRQAQAKLNSLELEYALIRGRSPVAHIQREKKESEPVAAVLFRGQYDQPRDKVGGATPRALHAMPPGAPNNRLGLAQWIVSPENPLTARVTVNRFWQEIFGVGIVKTAEDFGTMGEPPVNQALLDWLAVEFQESGWDVQHMFMLMVTSSTYRQSAATTPEKLEKDPQNRLLSRGPRFRMDGEMIRDCALVASGLMNPLIGGPSVRPYQPPGVWEVVGMPESNTRFYTQDHGISLYRRSMYTFWKRASPPASMDIFNAPSRETCSVRRERTDTPLQALVSLNDPQFMEASRKLAELAITQGHGRTESTLNLMAERLMARPFTPAEMSVVQRTLAEMEAYYQAQPDLARQLLSVGESLSSPRIPPVKLAAMTMVANQLLNLDEVLNK